MTKRSNTWITVPEILDELGITRRTWQRWRALGKTPPCTVLPNRKLRIRRVDFENWLSSLEERAA